MLKILGQKNIANIGQLAVAFTLSATIVLPASAQTASFVELNSKDIQNTLQADSYQLIEVGDNQIPIFIHLSEQALTKGIMLIIGDADSPLGKQGSLHAIAKAMPEYGWTTVLMPSLGLQLGPSIAFPIANEADTELSDGDGDGDGDADENGTNVEGEIEETETQVEAAALTEQNNKEQDGAPAAPSSRHFQESISEAQLVIYNKELESYIAAVLEKMNSTLGHRVIVSQGISAASITKLLADQSPTLQEIDAAVIQNPYWPVRELNMKIPMLVAQTSTPLLDLTSEWDNAWSLKTQRMRKIKSRTEVKEMYRQVEVIGQAIDERQTQYVAKLVKGWTTYLGW